MKKEIKKLSYIALLTIFSFGFASNANAAEIKSFFKEKDDRGKKERRERDRGKSPVGAPIDGGLLTILGAAGAGYYLMRKKNKANDKEE